MEKTKIKEYSNGELTVVWQPSKCIHSAICVHTLPDVYDPRAKPWIKVENATSQELIKQIDKCPSGALTYYINKQQKVMETPKIEPRVEVIKDGPLIVHGDITLCDADGNETTKSKRTAFCRCGHSSNKPYCDGAHKKSGFTG